MNYENDWYWTGKHCKWLSGLHFEENMEQLTLEEYDDEIWRLEEKLVRIEKGIINGNVKASIHAFWHTRCTFYPKIVKMLKKHLFLAPVRPLR